MRALWVVSNGLIRWLIIGALASAACSLFTPLDDLGGTDASNNDGGAGDAFTCPDEAGPTMVNLGTFCIDSTEVTQFQYKEFLSSSPDSGTQAPLCSWNTSFDLGVSIDAPNFPVIVNWCSAYAYCQWAGKHLCGSTKGGPADSLYGSLTNASYFACSGGGKHVHPYGDVYSPTACNGAEAEAGAAQPVGSFPGCEGGFPGLFDLEGNVAEWIDSCTGDSGQDDGCLLANTSYQDVTMACDTSVRYARNYPYAVGFRCCSP